MKVVLDENVAFEMLSPSFQEEFKTTVWRWGPPESLVATLRGADAMVVARTVFTAEILAQLDTLFFIQKLGAGVERIDIAAAAAHGIAVANQPPATPPAVAEHALMLMLLLARHFRALCLPGGRWDLGLGFTTQELRGKTLGIVGLGNIGREVARLAQAVGMRVLAYDPFVSREKMEALGVTKVEDLAKLMPEADFVSLHVFLTNETRGLIGERELSLMKPTAYLINTARGPVVEEGALYRALKERRIAGAGLDVFHREPPSEDDPLFQLDNVVATAHYAGGSREATQRMEAHARQNLRRLLEGQRPSDVVNPEVFHHPRWQGGIPRRVG